MTKRILIIGCGSIGERHLRAFLKNDQSSESSPPRPTPNCANTSPHTHQVETVADYREVIGRDDVTAALVATPAPSHVPIATSILEAGRHVLIEKPLSLDQTGLDDLVRLRDTRRTGRGHRLRLSLHPGRRRRPRIYPARRIWTRPARHHRLRPAFPHLPSGLP